MKRTASWSPWPQLSKSRFIHLSYFLIGGLSFEGFAFPDHILSWPELPERKPCPISAKLFTRDSQIKTLLPRIRKLRTSQLPSSVLVTPEVSSPGPQSLVPRPPFSVLCPPSSVARTTRRNRTPRLPSAGPEARVQPGETALQDCPAPGRRPSVLSPLESDPHCGNQSQRIYAV